MKNKMKYTGVFLVFVMLVVGVFSSPAFAKDTQSKGQPFEELWDAINDLWAAIEEIKLTPGPPGEDGINCWDLNANGLCDLPTEDKNSDGACDTLDCQGPKGDTGDTGALGPRGLSGYTGATGPTGLKGDKGDPCLSGYTLVSRDSICGPGERCFRGVTCPDGRKVLGGGMNAWGHNLFPPAIISSYPITDSTWAIEVANHEPLVAISVRVWAVCAYPN